MDKRNWGVQCILIFAISSSSLVLGDGTCHESESNWLFTNFLESSGNKTQRCDPSFKKYQEIDSDYKSTLQDDRRFRISASNQVETEASRGSFEKVETYIQRSAKKKSNVIKTLKGFKTVTK